MPNQAVNGYIEEFLRPQLKKLGADTAFTDMCCKQIEQRMTSLIKHWNDDSFRNAVLLTAEEEAAFCQPASAKKEIREFIVACVRNSQIDVMLSKENCIEAGLGSPISVKQMQETITKSIRLWNKQRMPMLSEQTQEIDGADYYEDLSEKYPIAWNVLGKMGNTRGASTSFEPIIPPEPFFIPDKPEEKAENGFSPYLSENVKNALAASRLRGGYIYRIESFSAFSRNMEALLCGMEYLFTRGGKFVTVNYYLSNGTAQRRIPLREPAHNPQQAEKNLKSKKGISELHAQALEADYNL